MPKNTDTHNEQSVPDQEEGKPHGVFSPIWADTWCFVALSGVAVTMAMIIAKLLFDIDLFSSDTAYDDPVDKVKPDNLTYIVGLVLFSFFLPMSIYRYRRIRGVLIDGIQLPYQIISTGMSKSDMVDIKFEYSFNDQNYQKRASINRLQLENGFKLIVNPNKPRHIIVK